MAEIDRVLGGYLRELTPSHVPDFENVKAKARRRVRTRGAAVVMGAVAVAVTGVSVVVGVQPGAPDPTVVAITARPGGRVSVSPPHARSAFRAKTRTGALADIGSMSCVNTYSPRTVADRAFAFDGTVVRIGPGATVGPAGGEIRYAAVTFRVNEWFRGGTSPEVTADMTPPSTSGRDVDTRSDEQGLTSYGIGSRLLVSGEPRWGGPALKDAVVFGCGFTRYYDKQTASAWRQAAR
jgi:hypothetical protein